MPPQNACWDEMVEAFYKQDKFDRVSEILTETRVLKEFQHLMVRHAFDSLGPAYHSLYDTQTKFLALLKKQYQEKYGI